MQGQQTVMGNNNFVLIYTIPMTKNLIKALTVFYLLTFIVSCDRPACNNTNSIFDKYSPETKIYKDELVKQLSNIDKSRLSYWMDSYQEDKNSQ